ncbi:MAG: DEAD/DEAH box helicase [Chlamydiales bacterium]
MDLEIFRFQAETMVKNGCVREVLFSKGTYQIEVYDPEFQTAFWPFLQFDEEEVIEDAFCSCSLENGFGCVHLMAAYLKISNKGELLHLRFENSFWNVLCTLSADHIGYEGHCLKKKETGRYIFQNAIFFMILGTKKKAQERLRKWVEDRVVETPENSIKFSNLSQEEIHWWRKGRPSPALRYSLSFWSDLAKWALLHEDQASICFYEGLEGLPTHLNVTFPDFEMIWKMQPRDLEKWIPTLSTIDSPLKLLHRVEGKINHIDYDRKTRSFHISQSKKNIRKQGEKTKTIGEWDYLSGKGFFSKNEDFFLDYRCIEEEKVSEFLTNYSEVILPFIFIDKKPTNLSYTLHFDQDWHWHFRAYLFEKEDLQQDDGHLFKHWVYLPNRGFFAVKNVLFKEKKVILFPFQVSHFVNHHRIWLNGQEGFQTHLASIDAYLTYSITKNQNLYFHTKSPFQSIDSYDFGDWIYYGKLGFFSKKYARLGPAIRPGMEIFSGDVSDFIKKNYEEVECIPHFFMDHLPLTERGLEITVKSESSIQIKPVCKGEEHIFFYGDFVYKQGEGFYELPMNMRLPQKYQIERIISQEQLADFFTHELPQIATYLLFIDKRLKLPYKLDLEVSDLMRTKGGDFKAKFEFLTEYGRITLTEIAQGYQKKQRYLFTNGGFIDLHDQKFQWIHQYIPSKDLKFIELTALEFIRLDTTFPLLTSSLDNLNRKMTDQILEEFRECIPYEKPVITGLKSKLRLYQEIGLDWLWFLYQNKLSALLCDEMGLGKTHQAMGLISAALNQGKKSKKKILVVCPTSVIYHWQDKLETFLPEVTLHTFYGLNRALEDIPDEGIVLTTYGILRLDKHLLEKIFFEVVIFDEIQVAKNASSRIHKALTHIQARMRLGLTGTPIENNLYELKALFDIILPGYMPSEVRYRKIFIDPIEREDDEKKSLLRQIIRPFVLRRRKSEVIQELPAKSEDKSYCELSQQQYDLYQASFSKDYDQLMIELQNSQMPVNYLHIFALLSRLKQICNHPALVEKKPQDYKKYQSGKWDLFVELIEEARESEQKVVVFSQYLHMLDIVENYLKEKRWGYAQIRGKTVNRKKELKKFQEDPNCVVFIGSLQAAGLGIDLTAASVVIMYDRWWNAARENQAIDRVHRIGQKWGVQVYKLITKGTIEEKIDQMISRKAQLLEEIVHADDQLVLKKLTRSELIELLTYDQLMKEK